MEKLLLLILFVSCASCVVLGIARRNGMIWYPFLFAVVILGWVFPQLLAISDSGLAPGYALSKTIFMIILCFFAGWLGYSWRTGRVQKAAMNFPDRFYSRRGLYVVMVASAIFGSYFFFKVSGMAEEANRLYGGLWSGAIAIYSFFAALLVYGFVLAVARMIQERRVVPLLTAMFCLLFFLHRILISGRREDTIILVITALLFLYFRYGWLIPRYAQIAIVVVGTLFVTSIGDYRRATLDTDRVVSRTRLEDSLGEISKIDATGNFKLDNTAVPSMEMFNAALIIEGAERTGSFDGGLSLWNAFVHHYVPAYFLGREFKDGLKFDLADVRNSFGFRWHVGTTSTGFADAFRSFWYFGALIFFAIGRVLKYWFVRAQAGDYFGMVMIMVLLPKSLLAITHHTHGFFLTFVTLFFFVIIPLRLMSGRKKNRNPLDTYRENTGHLP